MIIFPAVDIKNGYCVRLAQGKADKETVFSKDPIKIARFWEDCGAKWLHVVDLDGAFQGVPVNFELVEKICHSLSIPVQLGGGIRDTQTAENYFQAGVSRLIIGTLAFEDFEAFKYICHRFPEKIGISLDAEEGRLKSKGWVEDTGKQVDQILPDLERAGLAFLVYTDITRDGMESGVNIPAVERLLSRTSLPIIAAGGVSYLKDIKDLYPLSKKGLQGVITGKALYSGSLDFSQALDWIRNQDGYPG